MKFKIRKLVAKLLTFYILDRQLRKLVRNFIINFSLKDYQYYKNLNYKIVPLGGFCLPRVITTRIKLKPPKYYGEKSYPFDLNFHYNIKKITECIENDFTNYVENITFDKNKNSYVNNYFETLYNHDNELKLKEVKNRYKKRIQNFLEIFNSNKKIYFIYSQYYFEHYPTDKDIEKLYKSLKNKMQTKNFELILIMPQKIENISNKIHQIIFKNWENNIYWTVDFKNITENKKITLEMNRKFYFT